MDNKTELRIRQGYATILDQDYADDIQNELFPDLDTTADFNLETDAEHALEYLQNPHKTNGDTGIRLRNYEAAPTQAKKNIAQAIKAFWESNSFMPDDPDTIILISGTTNIAQYEPSLRGRINTF